MTFPFPWTTRKQRRRQEIGEKLTRERLACLTAAREAACQAVQDAEASGCTQRQRHALDRAREATHALRRAEMEATCR